MKYFAQFKEALSPTDLAPIENRAYATEGPELSFGHLDDRSFEILTYRLLSKHAASTRDRVTLMQGVGERGRDIVSYGADGRLRSIAQCKLLKDRLSHPDLLRELLKLSLHRHLDPEVVLPGLIYEIWAPGGFTEPAAHLVDTWPHNWSEEKLKPLAETVINEYAAFKQLSWSVVRESVLQFASHVELKKLSGEDISVLVRGATEIFDDFFIAKHVVDVNMLRRELKSALAEERTAASRFSHQGGQTVEQAQPDMPPVASRPQSPPGFFRARLASPTFTGRESTLVQARSLFDAECIVVLAGTGGIGKSAIAQRLAEEAAAAGLATYWLDGTCLDQQLAMLAFTFGVSWTPVNVQPLIDKLESQRACVVIDGLRFTPDVRGIPRPSSRVSIIATTRERGIVPLLPYQATLVDVSVLAPTEAQLLLRRLVGVPFPWTDEEVDRVADICGYLPLALVLVASALRKNMVPCAMFLDELVTSPIDTLDSNATSDQPGIMRTFAVALAELSSQERATLIALSVCAPGTWVDVIAFASQQSNDLTEHALSALQSISLVEQYSSSPPLWTMHDVVRYMCVRQPEAPQFAWRHAVSAMRQVEAYRNPKDWAYLEANLGEIIVAAERLTKSGFAEEVGATIRELIPHLRERGIQGRRTYIIRFLSEQLLPLLPKKSLSRAYFIGQLGLCAFEDGDREAAEQMLQQSLKLYKAQRSRTGEVSTLANMAHIDEAEGELARAAKRFRQAADILQSEVKRASKKQKPEWRRQSLIARWSLAQVQARRENLDDALSELETILHASTNVSLRDIHGRALWFKSTILWRLKRHDEALELGRLAIRELSDAGCVSDLLHALLLHAERALVAGFPSNALQAAKHAARIAERMAEFDELSYALALQCCAFLCLDKQVEATEARAAASEAARFASVPDATLARIQELEERIKPLPSDRDSM